MQDELREIEAGCREFIERVTMTYVDIVQKDTDIVRLSQPGDRFRSPRPAFQC